MFRCDACHEVTKPREKAHKFVVESRPKVYTDWQQSRKQGRGTEIVKEINVCPACIQSGQEAR
jgi:hypothetical protein